MLKDSSMQQKLKGMQGSINIQDKHARAYVLKAFWHHIKRIIFELESEYKWRCVLVWPHNMGGVTGSYGNIHSLPLVWSWAVYVIVSHQSSSTHLNETHTHTHKFCCCNSISNISGPQKIKYHHSHLLIICRKYLHSYWSAFPCGSVCFIMRRS